MKPSELTTMGKPLAQVAQAEELIEFPGNNQIDGSVGGLRGKIEEVLNCQ